MKHTRHINAARAILERLGQLSGSENVAAIRYDLIEAHRLLGDALEESRHLRNAVAVLRAEKNDPDFKVEPFSQLGQDAAWPAGSSRPPFDSL